MKRLGVRQRRTLVVMAVHGHGAWPGRWSLRNDDKMVLASLHRKGLVTEPDATAELTPDGKVAASWLQGVPVAEAD